MSDSSNDAKNEFAPSDLLIADLQHFGESMWRNEEIGEKRFNFFLSLVTAVVAGLVALTKLWISDSDEISGLESLPDPLRTIISVALLALFLVGIMTYLRMLQRNHVTDEYQRTLKALRQCYVKLCPLLQPYEIPVVRKTFRAKWLKGGYAETVGVINGILGGFLMFVLNADGFLIIAVTVLLVALQWLFAVVRRK